MSWSTTVAARLRLTNNPADKGGRDSAWSPNCSKIAFHSDRDGSYEIYVMDADGTDITRLTNNPADDGDPTWSPDGEQIVFHSNRSGSFEIYVMNADGSGQTRLTNNTSDEDFLYGLLTAASSLSPLIVTATGRSM